MTMIDGHLFTFAMKRRFLSRQVGAGQLLGQEDRHEIVFVRIFDVSGDTLTTTIRFLPLTTTAFEHSRIEVMKWLPLPDDWEALRDEWRAEWLAGEAGVFSLPLREITQFVFETVGEVPDDSVIDLAFPTRSESGELATIRAYVGAKTGA